MGKSTIEVMHLYAESGAEVLSLYKGKMLNSIELELGFMSFLCSKEVPPWRNGNQSVALKCLEAENVFLKDHINQWIHEFYREAERVNIEIGKEADFYLGVIRMVRDFTNFDNNLISSIIHTLKEK